MKEQQPRRFSDFAKEIMPLEGGKVKLDSVVNREIVVTNYRVKQSRYKKEGADRCLTLQFEMDGAQQILFTGSTVLADQIERYQAELPFVTIIKKIDKYYTFS
jgi:hypothetical protein